MDPLSILGTVLTISQIAHAIKASVDKVKGNKKRLDVLVGDIVKSLNELEKFSKAHVEEVGGCEQLRCAVMALKSDMSTLLTHCHKLVPRSDGSQLSKVKASVKAWSKRDELEAEMQRIKETIASCYAQFTAFTAARVENTAHRMENAIVVRGVEQQAHMQRLEVLVTNVLLDTRFGKQVIQQVERVMGEYSGDRSIETSYLCLQLDRTLDIMETHPCFRGPIVERVGDDFDHAFEPLLLTTVPHEFVVADLLVLSRNVRTSTFNSVYELARALETISVRLNDLLLHREAINAMKISVQLFRNLVGGGNTVYLTSLAHALKNLSIQLHNIGCYEEALLASEDALGVMRLVVEAHPTKDFRPNLALALQAHGDALSMGDRQEDALSTFAEAASLYTDFIEEIEAGTRERTYTILHCAANVYLSQSSALLYMSEYQDAFDALKSALLFISLASKEELDNHMLGNFPDRMFLQLCQVLSGLSTHGLALSVPSEAVELYRRLSLTDPHRFSEQFLRCLYAYAYICQLATLPDQEEVTVGLEHFFIFQLAFETDIVHTDVDHLMGASSFNAITRRLRQSEEGAQVMKRAIEVFLSVDINCSFLTPVLSDNIHVMVASFAAVYPDEALSSVQDALDNLHGQWTDTNRQEAMLTRVIALLQDCAGAMDTEMHPRVMESAERALEICRANGTVLDIGKLTMKYGLILISCGVEDGGIVMLEDGITRYRSVYPLLCTHSEMATALMEISLALDKVGRSDEGFKCNEEILEVYVNEEEEHLKDPYSTFPGPCDTLIAILIRISAFLMKANSPHYGSFAARAYELLSATSDSLPRGQSALYATLLQCLLRTGVNPDDILDPTFTTKAALGLDEGLVLAARAEDKFKVYENLIHFYALKDDSLAINSVVEDAYALHKEAGGGDIELASLGLRHDTLAVVASHYAKLGRMENVLPFANAAVSASKTRPRALEEDMPYLEAICNVAAYLWNSDREEGAMALLESSATAWRESAIEGSGEREEVAVDVSEKPGEGSRRSIREVVGGSGPERFRDDVRSYLFSQILAPSEGSVVPPDNTSLDLVHQVERLEGLVARWFELYMHRQVGTPDLAVADMVEEDDPCPTYVEQEDILAEDGSLGFTADADDADSPTAAEVDPLAASSPSNHEPSSAPVSESPRSATTLATFHPPKISHPRQSLITTAKSWASFVANLLVISWTLVFMFLFLTRSLSSDSNLTKLVPV